MQSQLIASEASETLRDCHITGADSSITRCV
jgi:hypothetical protein